MPRKTSLTIRAIITFALCALPGLSLAEKPAPQDYIANKPLLLEVRYCQCQATNPESSTSELLPGFLEESEMLRVGVAAEDKGFVSSQEFSLGYEVRPVDDSLGPFRFTYLGEYKTRDNSNAGQGTLILEEGKWVSLFGTDHQTESGKQHISVTVRLTIAEDF
jgi:hypothetical protein